MMLTSGVKNLSELELEARVVESKHSYSNMHTITARYTKYRDLVLDYSCDHQGVTSHMITSMIILYSG
jgi:hypothetical protein